MRVFWYPGVFLVLALVAVPHRPRTIIRAQIIAVVIDGGGQGRGHGSNVPGIFRACNCCCRNLLGLHGLGAAGLCPAPRYMVGGHGKCHGNGVCVPRSCVTGCWGFHGRRLSTDATGTDPRVDFDFRWPPTHCRGGSGWVGGGVSRMDAAIEPTGTYLRRPPECPPRPANTRNR